MKAFVSMLAIWILLVFGAYLWDRTGNGSVAQTVSAAAVKPVVVHYRAVLVAGDASIPNFDNATEVMAKRLGHSGDQATVLTADGRIVNNWRSYATVQAIDDALASVKPGEGCLVFMTSHGNEHGLVLGTDYSTHRYLTPTRLSQILARHCHDRPTVAILSGCHTGTFLKPEMEAPNRIILTAARKDRTSFGCSADLTFTYFDECFLEAIGVGGTWARIFDDTKACVAKKETAGHITPSLPQAYFGSEVQNLGIE